MDFTQLSDTKLDIHKAYARVWTQVPFYKIKVKMICEETPIGRSTFYSYYDNIEDLRNEVEDRLLYFLVTLNQKHFEKEITSPESLTFVSTTLEFVKQEEVFFRAFLIDQLNTDFISKWRQAIIEHLKIILDSRIENLDLKLEVISTACITLIGEVLKKPDANIKVIDLQIFAYKILF